MSIQSHLANRRFTHLVSRAAVLLVVIGSAVPAYAQSMVGKSLLDFSANYVIGPLGIFAVVVALAGSIFRPDLVRNAIYAAIICAVLFFIIKSADSLIGAFRN